MFLNAFKNLFTPKATKIALKKGIRRRPELLGLEDRIVPAVPFSPAFPHALSINAPGSSVTNSASFTVTFNQPVIGVDAADFQLVNTGTVANGTISSVTGSGATYTVNVTGITGSGTLGVNLVGQPSITALPSFAAQAPVPTGNDPRSVTLGDVNRDGILDIVTANASNSPNVSVCIGVGDGTFQTNVDYPTGNNPFSVTLGDVNGDGILDIITANAGSSDASVLIGNGDGSFKGKVDFPTGNNTSPKSVALGDVNGDGKLDIVTANGTVSSGASVLLNTTTAGATTASFSSPTPFATGNATFPSSVTLGDVNGDGKLDIVTTNRGSNSASVLLGNGDGSFKSENSFSTGNDPYSGTLGDVNGDGRLDIISGDLTSYTASVLLNTTTAGATTASFSSPTPFATGNGPRFVTLGDVNGDGRLDIVTANQPANTNSVLLGNGDGTFRPKTDFNAGNIPFSVTLGDVNRDGRLDIITANNSSANTSVLLGTGGSAITASFSPQQTFATGNSPRAVTLGDVNGDGILDIISVNLGDSNASVLLGNGNGTFAAQATFSTGPSPYSVILGDVNGDGKLDIVTANVSVLLGNGDGTFGTKTNIAVGNTPRSVTLGDVNGDGKLDIITANFSSDTASVLLGNGNGTFQTQQTFATGIGPQSVTLGDVNGDGKLDIITINNSDSNASVLLGNGNGTFQTQGTFATGNSPFSVTLGDVNGDGRLDIITANLGSSNAGVLLGNGDGTFQTQAGFSTGGGPISVKLGDVNGDGKLDIITANFSSDTASVLLGNGNGTFGTKTNFATGQSPFSVSLGDVNGDSRLDIITANTTSSDASVLLNSIAFTGQTANVQNLTPTTSTVVSSANPSVFGQSVTFTATVTGSSGTPTGTVTFKNGSISLGTAALNGSGVATLTTSALAVGSGYSITAEYGGDSNNQSSASSAVSQVVNQASTTTGLTSSTNPSVFGQSVTLTATVSAVSPGAGTATGTASFFDGITLLGTGTLTAGTATLSIASLAVGSNSITAVYNADTNFLTSTSSVVTQTVNPVAANTPTFGAPTATADGFTVLITNYDPNFTYGGTATANGTVAISNTGLVTVTGLLANTSSTATITTTQTGYANGSGQVTATSLATTAPLITGTPPPPSSNGASTVNLYDAATGQPTGTAVPFPGFEGPVKVASGDFNNDGVADLVAGAGFGGGPAIAILDSQTGQVMESFFAFDPAFTGGIFVAVQDTNGDGILDIIASAGPGGGPEVRIFNGANLNLLRSFYAYAADFTGGVSVASVDFNNDGILDLVTGAGPGGAPHVKVFDGATNAIISQWYAYPVTFTGGVFVAIGDIGNDGTFEVVTGAGQGGAPVVAVWDPFTGALLSQFMAYAEDFTGGARVAINDGNGDGIADILTGAGPGGGPHVKAFSFPALDLLFEFYSGEQTNPGGVFVG